MRSIVLKSKKIPLFKITLFTLNFFFLLGFPNLSDAHRSGCHRSHSCPSDHGTYICGDLGYCSQCIDNQYCEAGKPRVTNRPIPKKTPSTEALEKFTGKTVGVIDGDTIEVMRLGKIEKVRLAGVDCPEKKQAFGTRAKQFTSGLVFGEMVIVKVESIDRYGNTIGEVFLPDGRSINRELIKEGFAWWYRQYSKDNSLGILEEEARRAKRGLWVEPNPVPPWEFRKRN